MSHAVELPSQLPAIISDRDHIHQVRPTMECILPDDVDEPAPTDSLRIRWNYLREWCRLELGKVKRDEPGPDPLGRTFNDGCREVLLDVMRKLEG